MVDDASEALRDSEQRYRILFEQAPVGVFVYDRDLRICECNARFAEILHSSLERLIGLDMRTLKDKSVLPALERALLGDVARFEGPYEATTSAARIAVSMRLAPLRGAGGAVVRAMGVVEDVTERMKERGAEDALARSEAQFRLLIERAPDAIGVFSLDRRIVYANPALAALLGYGAPDELIGMYDATPIHPDDRAILELRKPQLLKSVILPRQEYRMLRRDGTLMHVEVQSLPVVYDGHPAVLSFARDLTEQKLMQARLLLAVRMVSVGTLAAGVAHEINNPLAYLMANLDMIATKKLPQLGAALAPLMAAPVTSAPAAAPGAPPGVEDRLRQIAEMVDIAREGADRVRNIVRDLKTFSRGDDERRGPVDVRRVLDASINMAWNEIRHRARLTKEYAQVPAIDANESRLGQVFLNLLVNAAQAMPVGGAAENTIRVATRTSPDGDVVVEVTDSGPGIPSEMQSRIFDPFFTTKPIGVGTGLGLWICEGIISSLGGTIGVESPPGSGATFRVTIPSRGSAAPATIPPPPEEPSGRRGRVLVVDDEVALARTVSSALIEENDVVTTSSGREALELLRTDDKFDVILCDLMMPDVTGMDLYEKVRERDPRLASRFVFLTGGAFTGRAREFLDSVSAPRIEKPFDISKLLSMMRGRVAAARR